MPSSRGAGQHEPFYATPTHPTTGSEVRMSHSGEWVACEGPGESEAPVAGPAHREASWIRTSEVRKQGQFVTVVEVEKDGEETAETTCHAWRATTQPVPRPAPRGFVTVVAVGTNTNTSLHLDHAGNLAVDSNVKLHMELPGAANADYVNQETIDRERKAAEEQERDADTPSSVPDQVVVYRLPGERLGLGLKFDGGMGAQECVRRLFIQSVAPDSPAARAAVPWGELHPGDQILNIEGCSVSSMTRVQCVSFLKDAAMKITIGVLKGNGQLPDLDTCTAKGQDYVREGGDYINNGSAHPPPLIVGEMRKRMPPPPLPPRAKPRKSPARPPKDPLPPPPSGFQDLEDDSSGQKVACRSRSEDKDHPEWRELLSRRGRSGDLEELLEDLEFHLPSSWAAKRLEDSNERGLPPRPSFYLDLVGEEDAAGPCESESDETSSSVSTVIDRLSLSSSTTVSRNSSFNASADASRFDLARVLSPFEQLEKELETEVTQEAQPASPATAPREEVASAPPVDRSTKPAATTPAPDPAPAVEAEVTTASDKTVSKTKTRSSIKSFALSLKGRPFSWQQGKNNAERTERGGGSRGEGLVSIRRPGKRPAPPPPPRSVAGGTDPSSTPPCTTSASATAGVKETSATSDSTETAAGNDDSYIDIVAEAAKEADIHKSATLRRNRLERQPAIDLTTEEETADFSISSPSERPKPEAEYLMLLDSPTVVDQVDALSVSAQDDKEEKNDGDGEVNERDSLDRSESLVNSESKAEEIEDDVTSQSSEDHDASSVVEENSYTAVHEETHALSRSYVETQAEVHHQPREGRLKVLEVEIEGQCGEVAQEDEGVKVGSSQDSDTEADGDDEGSGDEHRGGSEPEVCDTLLLGDAATSDDDDGDDKKASSDAVCHKLGQETTLHETAERKEVTNIDFEDGNVALVTEKEETADVKLHSEKIDNELNDSLVSEGTESDDVNDKGELKVEENNQVSDAEGGNETDVSMIEHSTRSESSMKVKGESDGEREEEHTDREAPAEDGGGRDDSREAEGDQNLYEEIDDATCGENQDQEDQEQEIYYSCSSRKQSAENSPRDLIINDSVSGEEEEEDRELYDDVAGPPSDQAWSESQDSSDLQGLKLSGPEEESCEQDTVDESFESLYDDVLGGDGSGGTEGVKGSTENTYENVGEIDLTEEKVEDVVVNGDGVQESNGGSVIKGVKGSMETVYENVEESEVTGETEVTLNEGVTSEASERVTSGGESEAPHGTVKTVTECVRHRRLRQDIGDLIRREMNLEDDVTVEVEEEEEVESTVECENEEELLLVMRALRRDQPGDSLRWLEDDSDDDEGAGGTDGGKEGTEESGGETEKRGQDPPGSAGDPQPAPPPSRGQSAQEDTGVVVARALSDPTGRRECPRAPPPSPPALSAAAAQSPVFPASTAAAAALHSLARGTSRHPHHTAAPHHRSQPLALPRFVGPRPADREAAISDGSCARATDKARTTFLTPIDETELDSTCEDASVVVDETLGVTESAKVKDSVSSEAGEPRVDAARGLQALTRPGTLHTSPPSTAAAMVARTDTNQGGKVASCPDDLQSLSVLALQGKEEVGAPLLPATPLTSATPLHLAPQDSEGAASATSSGDAASDGPSTPSTFCSDGEEQDDLEDEGRSSDNTPEPPDYTTHPDMTEPDADPQGSSVKEVEEVPAEGSVRAEPIVAVTQPAENQSTAPTGGDADGDVAASTHAEASFDTGGGGSVSVATCEHRFSSSGGAPPPYSRLPPDGHEFPSNYAEGLPDKMSRYARYSRLAMELDSPGSPPPSAAPTPTTPRTRSAPGTPLGPPPPIPRSSSSTKTYSNEKTQDSGNSKWAGGEERRSREPTPTRSRWRRQDERSERSVRDKIAMFSTDGPDQPHPKTRKLDKQEGEEGTMKRSFTEDDVRLDNSGSSSNKNGRDTHSNPRSLSKTSVFSSMINVSTSESKDSTKHISTASSEVDIRQETPPTPRGHSMREEKRPDDDSSASGLHSRSQSLIDIGRSSLTKRHSVGAYDRPSVYQYGIEKPEERERRTSLTNLIEQRRKSFGSKLLGLVIPESRGSEGGDKASIDLPRISSVPPTTASKTMSLPREGQRSPRLYKADSISSIDSCESNTSRHSSLNAPPWKSHGTSTLPKYSPAFKRKNMTVFSKSDNLPPPSGRSHSACSSSPTSDLSQQSPTPMSHSPPKSLENISPPSSEHTYDMNDGRYNSDKHSYSKLTLSQKNSLESRLNRAEDSDNDSAVSSTQSSYSQGMSPPSSPMPEQDELEDRRGRGYRSRLSQQNSIDEQEAARRVLKRGSIEAENRRNVINSARVSSGRNSDEHQTPEIIRKYSSASDKGEDSDRFPQRLDTELREGPKVTGLRRQASTSSTSSTASSRRSSHDSSRRNSRDSVIHVTKHDEAKVSAEPVYFDQEGEMYKESQLKVAYVNEITDDYEQLNDANAKEVIAEVPLSSPPSRRTLETKETLEANQTASSMPRKGTNRWAKLEMKYGSNNTNSDIETKIQRMRRASDSSSPDRTKKNSGGFRALAEKWQQRAEEDTAAPPHPNLARRESNSRLEAPVRASRQFEERPAAPPAHDRPARPSRLYDDQAEVDGGQAAQSDNYSESTQSSSNSLSSSGDSRSENLDIPRAEVPDRKLSMPEYGSAGVKMRDRREGGAGGAPSRPTSLIEGGDGGVMDSHYLTTCSQLSPAASTDSRDDLFTPETSLSRTASKEVLDAFSRPRANIGVSLPRAGASTTPKMADIMRAFERHDLGKRGPMSGGSSHLRMSSMDSTNSDEGLMGAHYGSVTSLASGQRDQYGSITSLASSTSLISPQELAQLIEEANQSLEESGTPSHEILVVVLHREVVAHGSIGITLAGGADYEAKEITVHKVIPGSLADRDGRIQRGDRVLSINGKNLRGVTHKEALSILKSPRPEVVLVLSRSRSVTPQESNMTESDGSFIHRPSLINHVTSPRPPKILESPMDSKSLISDVAAMSVPRGPPFTITLVKDGAGLGFSLEGGKDSPLGDRPLTVKKIFSGGAADKGGVLKVGDELVSVNTVDVTGMARIEAWNFLKKLPDGTVTLVLRQKLDYTAAKNEE